MECQDDNLIIGQNNDENPEGFTEDFLPNTLQKLYRYRKMYIVKYILSTFLENCRPDFD